MTVLLTIMITVWANCSDNSDKFNCIFYIIVGLSIKVQYFYIRTWSEYFCNPLNILIIFIILTRFKDVLSDHILTVYWYLTLIQMYKLFWVWTLNIILGSEQQWSCLQLTSRMDLFFRSSPDLWSASSLCTDPLCGGGGLSTPRGRYDLYRETSSQPAAGEPFYKWWNDKNRKSYFLTKAFFFWKIKAERWRWMGL